MQLSEKYRLLSLCLILLPICNQVHASWYHDQWDIMGTRVSVDLWHIDPAQSKACALKIQNEMFRIDETLSTYKPESELSRVNKNASIETVKISTELARLIEQSLQFSKLSNGAFDISYASIGYQYDFRKKIKPSEQSISENLESIDYRHIQLTDNNLKYLSGQVRIDLGGIAKGYAVDNTIKLLPGCGISKAMISAGGDSRILGDRNGKPWIIGIQHPRKPDAMALVLPLSDTAISTSGDYQRFYIDGDKRIHHILNPSTGKPADGVWSTTVTGPDAMTTDALSTSIFVMGPEAGLALIEKLDGFDAIIIDNKGQVHFTSGLEPPENRISATN